VLVYCRTVTIKISYDNTSPILGRPYLLDQYCRAGILRDTKTITHLRPFRAWIYDKAIIRVAKNTDYLIIV